MPFTFLSTSFHHANYIKEITWFEICHVREVGPTAPCIWLLHLSGKGGCWKSHLELGFIAAVKMPPPVERWGDMWGEDWLAFYLPKTLPEIFVAFSIPCSTLGCHYCICIKVSIFFSMPQRGGKAQLVSDLQMTFVYLQQSSSSLCSGQLVWRVNTMRGGCWQCTCLMPFHLFMCLRVKIWCNTIQRGKTMPCEGNLASCQMHTLGTFLKHTQLSFTTHPNLFRDLLQLPKYIWLNVLKGLFKTHSIYFALTCQLHYKKYLA